MRLVRADCRLEPPAATDKIRKMSGNQRGNAQTTRRRLLDSFNSLVLDGAEGKITVAHIVQKAGVGRSTFYDHYSSADDIHQQAIFAPMTILADSILGVGERAHLVGLMDHFQEYRQRARQTLCGGEGEKVEQLLVEILDARLGQPGHTSDLRQKNKIAAIELAVVPMALIRAWLNGTIRCSSEAMASHILTASTVIRKELL